MTMSQLHLFHPDEPRMRDNFKKTWSQLPFLCVDTETTGLDHNSNRIIEVAWIMFENEKEIFSDSRLCSIGMPLPSEIVDLTGIHDGMLVDKPPFSAHANDLLKAMSEAQFIVAYNAKFDRLFLEAELCRIGKTLPDLPWVDPCIFIREVDRYQKGKRLQDASARWGVNLEGAHRALADATATGLLLYKLIPHLKNGLLRDLMIQQNRWQEEQEHNYNTYMAKKQRP
jgi:DNA polymerase III alpha subunit (gram-positive type)